MLKYNTDGRVPPPAGHSSGHHQSKRREQSKPQESRQGLRAITNQYGFSNQYRTIMNRYNEGRTIAEAREAQQRPCVEIQAPQFSDAYSELTRPDACTEQLTRKVIL